jgi:cellulose synthase/poly-beta-1,6-N-acetylglucosamine synthase-like glycosyltransferase
MMPERLSRRDGSALRALEAVREAEPDVPCSACSRLISPAARFCRSCGVRQPMARPLIEVTARAATQASPGQEALDVAATLRPPLIALWGPLDDLRWSNEGGRPAATAEPVEPVERAEPVEPTKRATPTESATVAMAASSTLPVPSTFGSFSAESLWSPRAALPSETPMPVAEATIGRCSHARKGRSTVALCGVCGGVPGPRVVTARMDGSGHIPLDMSARETLSADQRRAILTGVAVLVSVFIALPMATLIGLIALATVVYLAILIQRIRIFALAMDQPDMVTISDEDARSIPPSKLPIYTILVPAYREPQVIAQLLAAIQALDYPVHKLDIKLLLEQDDPETLEAALAANPGPHVEIVRVPPIGPRTKPKACVVGLARARGQYVTIFDAEDQPEPLQLRRAIVAFRRHSKIACFQAKLSYRNADRNLITRWFSAEYAMWFNHFLPGLSRLGVPLPLGGTSNHFRRRILRDVGGWDPYNVTEDADLGIRLSRAGYKTAVLDSTTLEEANGDFVNWAKQRSRWYKGYLQTWLIHMRQPRRLWRELGPKGFIGFNLFVGGTPIVALLNPIFWALTAIWFLAKPEFVQALFPAWLYYAGLACFIGGNFVFLYGAMVSARATGKPKVVLAAALSPIYWVMMSIAALKAGFQLIHAPSFWEKTTHGLDLDVSGPTSIRVHGPSS